MLRWTLVCRWLLQSGLCLAIHICVHAVARISSFDSGVVSRSDFVIPYQHVRNSFWPVLIVFVTSSVFLSAS